MLGLRNSDGGGGFFRRAGAADVVRIEPRSRLQDVLDGKSAAELLRKASLFTTSTIASVSKLSVVDIVGRVVTLSLPAGSVNEGAQLAVLEGDASIFAPRMTEVGRALVNSEESLDSGLVNDVPGRVVLTVMALAVI